jgi:hypothetical protein
MLDMTRARRPSSSPASAKLDSDINRSSPTPLHIGTWRHYAGPTPRSCHAENGPSDATERTVINKRQRTSHHPPRCSPVGGMLYSRPWGHLDQLDKY